MFLDLQGRFLLDFLVQVNNIGQANDRVLVFEALILDEPDLLLQGLLHVFYPIYLINVIELLQETLAEEELSVLNFALDLIFTRFKPVLALPKG